MRVILRLLGNMVRLALWPVWSLLRLSGRAHSPWIFLRLDKHLTELRAGESLWRRARGLRQRKGLTSIEELRELVAQLARDPQVTGLCLSISSLELGWAGCQNVRELLLALRRGGKRVVCQLAEGGGNRELYLASAADRIVLTPWSTLGPLGFATRPLFFRELLRRIGVDVHVHATGEYKTAAEPFARDSMSDASRAQQSRLLETLHDELLTALRERGVEAAALERAFGQGYIGAHQALELGLVDELRYEDELAGLLAAPAESETAERSTASAEPPEALALPAAAEPAPLAPRSEPHARDAPLPWMAARSYLAQRRSPRWKPLRQPPYVAVVRVTGTIVHEGYGFRRAAERPGIVAALRKAGRDRLARAVVLHVDSPGGSAFASELIHREVQLLARKKPVVAYFGDVAASGGYYIASACHAIVARPLTITGSIGVISMQLGATGLLERLGVRAEVLKTSPHADMLTWSRALSPEERRMLDDQVRELYGRFLEVVADGRSKPLAEVDALARGRVWSGSDAHERGLVDALGGIERALELARARLPELSPAEREALELKPCSARPEATQLPPAASEAAPASWLGDLAFALHARRELCAYYAWDVLGLV